ncbi:flagellar hook-basal body complex protein [Sedimentibacter hydroxybenzoicus DSM 7310]|uniref:Flagellar hook protein FlgE n=1 Tax=Sedimentibacter hydroxybenzoicus DSM 7310 TaxID=1123245 RepID=A0A974BGF5_SEDHY|nr:flagellar hook-basal body complex protein [Sedimentibacter hydroxybenzoicus]NYB72598.1 flagellar hook-basal body complex protein [Sedimentibacter hydroxybenzoicus DSM 7310]
MMKALYSGVSGMRSHQTKMDVIGNNIANVNTYGYKSQRTTFRDVYYQQLKNPGGASVDRGGTNAAQVGYGAQIGSVDTIHTISGYSPTNKSTDIYINGEGFLTVETSTGQRLYTRLGALGFDSAGNLVDVNGSRVYGWNDGDFAINAEGVITVDEADLAAINIAPTDPDVEYTNITINTDGLITAVYNNKDDDSDPLNDTIVDLGVIAVASIQNQDALVHEGNSYYRESKNTGEITYNIPGSKGSGTGALVTGGLEMSNVDLANEFSDMIITQRGYQANTKIISVVDQMLEELVNLKR